MAVEGSGEHGSGYMLDTTEFNAVAKGDVAISAYSGWRLFATHVQLDELDSTTSEQMRARLRAAFEKIAPESLATESTVWGVSKWGGGKWSAEDSAFKKMLARLEREDGRKRHPNQTSRHPHRGNGHQERADVGNRRRKPQNGHLRIWWPHHRPPRSAAKENTGS